MLKAAKRSIRRRALWYCAGHTNSVGALLSRARAGELSSDDDFYLLDSGLAVLQTTNDIRNASLYDLLDFRSVVSWQRVNGESLASQVSRGGVRVLEEQLPGEGLAMVDPCPCTLHRGGVIDPKLKCHCPGISGQLTDVWSSVTLRRGGGKRPGSDA